MVALATPQQVIDLAETDPTDGTRVAFLLEAASAAVRRYTGQQFTRSATTERLRVGRNDRLRLPQRPVNAVTTVETPTGIGLAEGSTWVFDGIDELWFSCRPWVGLWYPPGVPADVVDVTYDHGYDETPADVVAVVCGIVLRAYGSPSEQGGIVQESITNYSYGRGSVGAAGAVGLLPDEKRALDVFRRVGGTITLSP